MCSSVECLGESTNFMQLSWKIFLQVASYEFFFKYIFSLCHLAGLHTAIFFFLNHISESLLLVECGDIIYGCLYVQGKDGKV